MKFENSDRKEISEIYFLPERRQGEEDHPKDGERFFLSYEYHGDHAENWVVVEKDGVELRRYSTLVIDTIIWK